MADSPDVRVEHDSLGEVLVPADARWGAQTQRAVENFPISGQPVPAELIQALALVKSAAARTNADLGILDQGLGEAIAVVADELAAGAWSDQFPVDVFQTGSGTSTNMNVNEVVASLAAERLGRPVHPNDHVNASQSSNDTFPTALHVAAARSTTHTLVPALWHLHSALERQALALADVVKPGRTHLMDATPVTLGQEFQGYASQVALGVERLQSTLPRVLELALGGTAVGTGLNAPPRFAEEAVARLADATGLPFVRARDAFEAQSARDAAVELSGQLRVVALGLAKISNDLRWMNSGPRAGLREIELPDLQPGSSIMPGKVNPVVPEAVVMVAAQVVGNDAAVAFAASTSSFELNVAMPVIARNLLESIRLLAAAATVLADRAVDGLKPLPDRTLAAAESSTALVTPLARLIGYEEAARVAQRALRQEKTIRQVVTDLGLVAEGRLSQAQLDEALDTGRMARPHGPPASDAQ